MSLTFPVDVAIRALVVAKAPEPGRTKTRLASDVGAQGAAMLSAAALLDTLAACTNAFGAAFCHLAVAGSLEQALQAERIRASLSDWHTFEQTGTSFGDRLANAHQRMTGPVIQIGMDTPQVTAGDLLGVASLLEEADAVVAPATDGGWWALALRDPAQAQHLRGVAMSRPSTGADTVASLEAGGLTVATAHELRDVDFVQDAEVVAACAPSTAFARQWRALRATA